MNTTPAEGVELLKGVAALKGDVCSCVNFIVIPPFTHLSEIVKNAKGTGIAVGAQNCAAEAKGAYTGEVSAKMIASLGVEYVILGHSERREYYGETSATLNKKMVQAYENNLIPIYCVGEKLEERENGKYFDVVRAQIEEVVFNLTPEQFSKLIIAYEPVWAIGTGKTATAEQAQEIHAFIRKVLAENLKQQAHKEAKLIADAEALAAKLAEIALTITAKAEEGRIFGSVTAANVAEALNEKGIAVDRKSISVDPVKTIGAYEAAVKLYKGISATVKFEVVAEA